MPSQSPAGHFHSLALRAFGAGQAKRPGGVDEVWLPERPERFWGTHAEPADGAAGRWNRLTVDTALLMHAFLCTVGKLTSSSRGKVPLERAVYVDIVRTRCNRNPHEGLRVAARQSLSGRVAQMSALCSRCGLRNRSRQAYPGRSVPRSQPSQRRCAPARFAPPAGASDERQ